MFRALTALVGMVVLGGFAPSVSAQSLKGSTFAMQRQQRVAREHDYTLLRTKAAVRRFTSLGLLVPVRGTANYSLAGVSHPYARPALRTFVTRLAAQYRSACGEKLVVTSLTRPLSEQPRNASDLSVHPAGMAVDFRVSRRASCRKWLERTLLSLEKQKVLDATRERRPAHYHVALFPAPYLRYVQGLPSKNEVRVASNAAPKPARTEVQNTVVASAESAAPTPASSGPAAAEGVEYVVHAGDTLWSLARRYGTSVDELKQLNQLSSSRIAAGQVITVPASSQ